MSNTDFETTPGVDTVPGIEAIKPKLPPAQPKSREEFEALEPGTEFVDPEGQTRKKPYMPKTAAEFSSVPEGAQFVDPEGQLREKPVYEGIDFTAQTLYDMALTPKEKKKALERSYPGKVKEDESGLYIDDDGKLRRPGRGVTGITGFMASSAAPTGGAILGALGGGAAGSAVPGAGTVAGSAAGGAGGAILGQSFNDAILQLAGVYDRTLPEEAANMGMAAASGAAGAGVGRGIATVVPSVKAGVSAASAALPHAVASFLGSTAEDTEHALKLAEKGVLVPPSAHMHESPHVQNIVEVFDPAFRTNKPLRESAVGYYERETGRILGELGVDVPETKDVTPLKTGERILQRALAESAEADARLQAALERRAAELQAKLPGEVAQRELIAQAARESRDAAQKLIDQGFKDIESDAAGAMKVAQAGHYSGDLWEHVGAKLRAIRQGIGERARYRYDRYDQMTGGATVSSQELAESAQQMLDELPAEFKSRNPVLVDKLAKLTKEVPIEGAQVPKGQKPPTEIEHTELTYGQLHDMRSVFRGSADWHTLSSDFKNGALKRFSNEIDRLIHDPEAPEHVRAAGKFLDMVDKWYAKNIKIFNAKQMDAVMKGLEAGEPADPAALYNTIVKEGHTDLMERIKKMVGPNLWHGIAAADTRAMLDASKTLEPGVIDARKFAREVLERHRANTLSVVHGAEAEKLLAQARAIEQLDGRLAIPSTSNDTLTDVIRRARNEAEKVQAAAKQDPLGTLNKEMKKIKSDQQREIARMRKERNLDPLGFLYDPTTGAIEATNKILGNEDLILAAAVRFGEKSPEFSMLRQLYVSRIFDGTLTPGSKLEKISPEIQRIMFPGATFDEIHELAGDMSFLMERRGMGKSTAGSMSAMSKIENPVVGIRGLKTAAKVVPGLNPAARAIKGKFYAMVTYLATRPATLQFILKGLKGSPEERAAVKQLTDKVLQKGSAVGAGAAESAYQGAGE